mmetsp:Transcript_12630/g.18111  ORF Transcript_12630/g.18111 Transcript_12630/m.18111 type:complete len:391 (+) Transcript_12630:271-1443(+)
MMIGRPLFFRHVAKSMSSQSKLKQNNHAILSVTAAIGASAAFHYYFYKPNYMNSEWSEKCYSRSLAMCEKELAIKSPSVATTETSITKSVLPKPLPRATLLLYNLKLIAYSSLPTPRLMSTKDPVFSYPDIVRGVRRRQADEVSLQKILSSERLMAARQSQDQQLMQPILQEVNELVYGKGVTPQIREDFLAQYGCVGHTPEIVKYLVDELAKDRGIVEVGAGNGQWARAINDFHNLQRKQDKPSGKAFDLVLAFDNMQELPLSPKIYHQRTVPAKQYFYDKVKLASHIDAVKGFASRGRVLMLVYPSPGSMALETVKAYIESSDQNDTVVYVGEGIGGANADEEFFNYFLGKTGDNPKEADWVLLKVMEVRRSPGGKGYEKMFVFQRKR